MICLLRHILAIVHFNSNLQRKVKKKEDGVERVKVLYPKFKNGEATVRNARIVQNFDYVEEIFQTYLKASKDDLDDAASKLKRMVPAPMNSMLDKQPRGEAVEKMEKRRSMVVADIPPTIPVSPATTSTTALSKRPTKRSNADSTVPCGIPQKKARRNNSSSTKKTKKQSNAGRKRKKD
ncbi:uncharacterized protein LOC141888915 [Acropora palmata]|uniref:uncharacterized protein LOC141888915 n=1 Tax=Acropora palmata TaxID=6131 RepID=UPI003DA0BCFB